MGLNLRILTLHEFVGMVLLAYIETEERVFKNSTSTHLSIFHFLVYRYL